MYIYRFNGDLQKLLQPIHIEKTEVVYESPSSSIKVSIAAPKFATSTLMTASLKVVTIECIEHDETYVNERVFIKTMNHLLTNCSQSTSVAMICRLSLLVLNTSLAKCEGLCYAIQ